MRLMGSIIFLANGSARNAQRLMHAIVCRSSNEKNETAMYFQKMRAYSDFALEIPYNPTQIRSDMEALLDSLSESALSRLQAQYDAFAEDLERYA